MANSAFTGDGLTIFKGLSKELTLTGTNTFKNDNIPLSYAIGVPTRVILAYLLSRYSYINSPKRFLLSSDLITYQGANPYTYATAMVEQRIEKPNP